MRKVLALFLCLVLCLGLASPIALADDDAFTLTVDQGSCTVRENEFTITGIVNRDATVSVAVSGAAVGKVEAKANEKFTVTVKLNNGDNKVRVSAMDADFNLSNNKDMTIRVVPNAPYLYIDQVPNMDITIPEYFLDDYIDSTGEFLYTLSGTMDKPGQVRVIINDDNKNAQYVYTSGPENKWSFTFDLDKGNYSFYVSPTSSAGANGTSYKLWVSLTDDGKVDKDPPTITAFSGKNETVKSPEYTITGTISEPGYVQYKLNGVGWTKVECDENNNFTVTLTLKEWDNDIRFQAVDLANNESTKTTQIKVTYEVDYEPPVLELDKKDETVKAAAYTLTGSLDEAGKVIVTLNGGEPFEVVVNSKTFAFTTNLTLKEGENTIKVVPVDEAGNEGEAKEIKVTYKAQPDIMGTLDKRPSTQIAVMINGKYVDFKDTPPSIINSRTMVPMRAIFEIFGCEIEWNDATKTVTATKDGKTIKLTINSPTAYIDGKSYTLDAPATIVNSRTLVPLRFISEALNATVTWDDATKTAIITTE